MPTTVRPRNPAGSSKYGNQGLSFTADKSIPKNERGHPITHQFTRAIPTSQCMNCHMHQGNLFVNPYLGYTWWDQETRRRIHVSQGSRIIRPTRNSSASMRRAIPRPPPRAGSGAIWIFCEKVAELNPKLKHTQFADYHGHGWIFRAVFKHDRKGNLLDLDDNIISHDDPQKFAKAVHLKDVHLAHGMQCVDCHFLNGRARQRQALRRTARRDDHRVHRLPRHRSTQRPDAHHFRQRAARSI